LLEQLGPEQGIDEVEHEPRGHEAGERIIEDHGTGPLQSVAGDGVTHRQGEKGEAEGQQNDVQHLHAPGGRRRCAVLHICSRCVIVDWHREDVTWHPTDIFSR
jgi:hypothetical protein